MTPDLRASLVRIAGNLTGLDHVELWDAIHCFDRQGAALLLVEQWIRGHCRHSADCKVGAVASDTAGNFIVDCVCGLSAALTAIREAKQ